MRHGRSSRLRPLARPPKLKMSGKALPPVGDRELVAVAAVQTRARAGGTSTTTQVGEFRGSKLSARGSFRGEGALARTKSVPSLALLGSTTTATAAPDDLEGLSSGSGSRQTVLGRGRSRGQVAVRPKFFCARGRARNPRRAALRLFWTLQREHLKRFRKLAAEGHWAKIHVGHYDWWMFPIEDGSKSEFNVFAGDVAELKALAAPPSSPEGEEEGTWLEGYVEAVGIVSRAWGWDLRRARAVSPLSSGMGWTFWDIRLAKMLRSLWVFDQNDALESLQKFARQVKPEGGLRYGRICLDEVFFMVLRPVQPPPAHTRLVVENGGEGGEEKLERRGSGEAGEEDAADDGAQATLPTNPNPNSKGSHQTNTQMAAR